MKCFLALTVLFLNLLPTISLGAPPSAPISVPVGSTEYKDISQAFKKIWPNYSPVKGAQPLEPLPISKLPSTVCGGKPVYVINFGELKVSVATPKDAGGGWIGSGGPLKLIAGLDSKQKVLTELYSDHMDSLGATTAPQDCPDIAVTVKSASGMQAKTLGFDSTQGKYHFKGN